MGLEPTFAWPTTKPLVRFGIVLSAPRRNRTSVPWVWARCSPIELAELACSQEDSNLHMTQLRRLSLCPLSYRSKFHHPNWLALRDPLVVRFGYGLRRRDSNSDHVVNGHGPCH